MIAVMGVALSEGNPQILINGYDWEGQVCGTGALAEYKLVYYPQPTNLQFSVCLKNCTSFGGMCVGYKPDASSTYSKQAEQYEQFVRGNYSWCFLTYPTIEAPGINRCVPDITLLQQGLNMTSSFNLPVNTSSFFGELLGEQLSSFQEYFTNGSQVVNDLLASLERNKDYLIITAAVGLVVGVIYMFLLQLFACPIVWLTIVAVQLVLAGAAVIVFVHVGVLDPQQLPGEVADQIGKLPFPSAQSETERNIYIGIGAVLAVAAVIVFLLILVLFTRINMAIKVIQQAAKAIRAMPAMFIIPLVVWVIIMGVFAYWVVIFLFLASAGEFSAAESRYVWDDTLRYMILYHLFGLLWTRAFLSAVSELMIAGSVSQWYFPQKGSLSFPVLAAVKNTLRYHLGSAAFGSFIIAVVEMIRVLFNYFCAQMKAANQDNPVVKCMICCVNCCLACLERFINYLNRNAYIQVAIHGVSFCKGAKDGFSLLLRNCLRVAAITPISSVFVGLGKIFITAVTAFLGALIMTGFQVSQVANADPFVVIIMILIGGTVGASFMSVYSMAIDTVFQCYCMDEEWGSGSTSSEFKSFMKEQEQGTDSEMQDRQ
eukprot:JP446011.1.p1 GENE.JP446011.1~~JP446011.1.p1  ORF type:complete len:598 (-),score=136.03 JP446011.1:114-1907(-)